MLDFKARCDDDVRWRSLGVAHIDPYIENYMSSMLDMLGSTEQTLWALIWQGYNDDQNIYTASSTVPHSMNDRCTQFLEKARLRSLGIFDWKSQTNLLAGKDLFFEELPDTAMDKFIITGHEDIQAKCKAVCGLINLHRGEVVEVRQNSDAVWSLIYAGNDPIVHNPAVYWSLPEQFELGSNYSQPELNDYDRNVLEEHMRQVRRSPQTLPVPSMEDLRPDFENQMNRLVVPCVGTDRLVWVRSTQVITLGELFLNLHTQYSARAIYYLYLHLDIVALKHRKQGQKKKRQRI
jgi:hypothetical protein